MYIAHSIYSDIAGIFMLGHVTKMHYSTLGSIVIKLTSVSNLEDPLGKWPAIITPPDMENKEYSSAS